MTADDELPDKGTYTLVISVQEPTTVRVGALGDVRFDAATYAYTGSAFGAGGMKRVERHRRTATGENDTLHWHIDYLLGTTEARLVAVYAVPDDAECGISRRIEGDTVEGFGASDCDCEAHLKRAKEEAVAVAYDGYREEQGHEKYALCRFDG